MCTAETLGAYLVLASLESDGSKVSEEEHRQRIEEILRKLHSIKPAYVFMSDVSEEFRRARSKGRLQVDDEGISMTPEGASTLAEVRYYIGESFGREAVT